MKHRINLLFMFIYLIIPMAAVNAQQEDPSPQRDPAEEQVIYDDLAAINPDAVVLFKEATLAMDSNHLDEAEAKYRQVLEMAGDFAPALRRLSYVVAAKDHFDEAVDLARKAVEVEGSAIDQAALASALNQRGTSRDQSEALGLAQSAAAALPDDPFVAQVLIVAGAGSNDMNVVRQGVATLLRVAPNDPSTHYFNGLLEASDKHWIKAEDELLLAKQMGLPADAVDHALNESGIAGQARLWRLIRGIGYSFAGWIAGLGVLFVVGVMLSSMTLASVKRARPGADYRPSAPERFIRFVYRGVVTLSSLYFYISIPFLILAVVGLTVGIFYLFFAIGRIPVQLAIAVGLGAIYSLVAIVRSLFIRIKQQDPGLEVGHSEAPALWDTVEEVARKVNARPVNKIFVTPMPEVAVTERGGMLRRIAGAGERILILGMGALPGMTRSQLRAILAHEYGHFSNRDTAGGGLAIQVRASILTMAQNLAQGRQNTWFNPVFLFLNGFYRIFLRITLGASRLQEILADRYAALAYGAHNFSEALTNLVRQTMVFNAQASREIQLSLNERRQPNNLYTLSFFEELGPPQGFDAELDRLLTRPTSPYDSHPAVKDRLELVRQLEDVGTEENDSRPALDLLPNPEHWQQQMSSLLYSRVTTVTRPPDQRRL